MKTTFKMGEVRINVNVVEEADVSVNIDGIETSFEGTAEEVIAMYKETAGIIKDVIVAQLNAQGCCDC